MNNIFVCFGYAASGKSTIAHQLALETDYKIFAVDNYSASSTTSTKNSFSNDVEKFKSDKYGLIFYNMLIDISTQSFCLDDSIIIDAPLIDENRRKALFEVLSNMKIKNLIFFQVECKSTKVWKERLLLKSKDIKFEIFEEYRNNFEHLHKYEFESLQYANFQIIKIDTSKNHFSIKENYTVNTDNKDAININKLLNMETSEINNSHALELENYKMLVAYISDINKKIDLYIKLNLTLFVVVITFIIGNLSTPMIKYAFIPLTLINWISYKYFDANHRLLVTMQAHLAQSYEKYLKNGWYIKSLKFRESKSKKEKKKKHFSPINFYGFLIVLSLVFYLFITANDLIINRDSLFIDFDSDFNLDLFVNIIISIIYIAIGIYASVKILSYPDWPSTFKQKYDKLDKL
jgi:adenylate kinase family enzyme